jgi:hypothetical protein
MIDGLTVRNNYTVPAGAPASYQNITTKYIMESLGRDGASSIGGAPASGSSRKKKYYTKM